MTEPRKVCEAGHLPMSYLDQDARWVDTQGFEHEIAEMPLPAVLWTVDYLLGNAKALRQAWSIEHKTVFDSNVRARRWMLDRPLLRGLMRRISGGENADDRVQRLLIALHTITLGPILGPETLAWAQQIAKEALDHED